MISEILNGKSYATLMVTIYNKEDEIGDWWFEGNFEQSQIMYDGEEICATIANGCACSEIVIPIPSDENVKWFNESECYEFIVGENRYELYFSF